VNRPLVTIMIPTYNQAELLPAAIDSALAQRYRPLEVVVADDASTDTTADVVAGYRDARLRYVRRSDNLGRVGNYRRTLVDDARGTWVLNLDGDDRLLDDDYLVKAISLAERHPQVALVFARALDAPADGGPLEEPPINRDLPEVSDGTDLFLAVAEGRVGIPHLTALYRRDVALELDFYTHDVVGADSVALLSLLPGRSVGFIDTAAAVWTKHEGNATWGRGVRARLDNFAVVDVPADRAARHLPSAAVDRWRRRMGGRLAASYVADRLAAGHVVDGFAFLAALTLRRPAAAAVAARNLTRRGWQRFRRPPAETAHARRVAMLIPDLGGGGAERVFVLLAEGLAAAGCEVDLLLFRATGPHLASVPDGVRVVDLGAERSSRSLGALWRYLRERRPGALVSALHNANLVAVVARALSRSRTRLILTVHNDLEREFAEDERWRSGLIRALLRWLYPLADRVVAVSEGVRSSLVAAHIATDRLDTIVNPVVTDAMFARAREEPPHPWLDDAAVPTIVSIGRLEPQKDHATLLDAFAEVLERREARLLIFGEGAERERLERRIDDLGLAGSVALPGYVSNPYAALARARVFALSSRFEGLPTVLIEALALGCRIVATDCPWGPSEILDGGALGTLVPVGDSGALAAALVVALDEGRPETDRAAVDAYRVEPVVAAYLSAMGVPHRA
jgi:glycosyltransferase involved in cell wall biosynthesis